MGKAGASSVFALAGLIVYWGLCFIITHVPLSALGGIGHSDIPHRDKLAHLVLYSGLAWLLSWVFTLVGWKLAVRTTVFLVVVGYGALDEWLQSFIPSRSMDFADWLADVAGACLGMILFELWLFLSSGYRTHNMRVRQRLTSRG